MIVTVKEFCELTGYSDRTGYVQRNIKAGKLLPRMKRAFKSGGTWLIEMENDKG